MSNKTTCLDPAYATTRLVTRVVPIIENTTDLKIEHSLFLPPNTECKGEGGLRTKAYFKKPLSSKPLISVITVVFNGEKYLEKSVQSVINQKYDNVEYIIIDGGSTDGTTDIIKKYEGQIDYWVSEKDDGIYDAMNKGVSLARGNWIYFLGSDDILLDVLEQVSACLKSDSTVLYGDVYYPKAHKLYDGVFHPYKFMLKNISQQGIFYPRSVFAKYAFNQKYQYQADYELNIRCYFDGYHRFEYMPILIAVYNDENGKSTLNNDAAFYLDKRDIINNNFPFIYSSTYMARYYILKFLDAIHLKKTLSSFIVSRRY